MSFLRNLHWLCRKSQWFHNVMNDEVKFIVRFLLMIKNYLNIFFLKIDENDNPENENEWKICVQNPWKVLHNFVMTDWKKRNNFITLQNYYLYKFSGVFFTIIADILWSWRSQISVLGIHQHRSPIYKEFIICSKISYLRLPESCAFLWKHIGHRRTDHIPLQHYRKLLNDG